MVVEGVGVFLPQDDALKVVGQLPGLRQLRAVGCAALTDLALHQLSALQGLVQLDLGCNAHITDAGIAALATMQGAVVAWPILLPYSIEHLVK